MKRVITLVMVIALASLALAGDSDIITVNYEVTAINEISIADASVTLTVNSAVAGLDPTAVTAATTYDLTTNESSKKITAKLDTDMDAGLTLSIDVTAPTTGTGAGSTDISASGTGVAADVVTAIGAVAESALAIDFNLAATVAAGVVAADAKTLTLTIAAS